MLASRGSEADVAISSKGIATVASLLRNNLVVVPGYQRSFFFQKNSPRHRQPVVLNHRSNRSCRPEGQKTSRYSVGARTAGELMPSDICVITRRPQADVAILLPLCLGAGVGLTPTPPCREMTKIRHSREGGNPEMRASFPGFRIAAVRRPE